MGRQFLEARGSLLSVSLRRKRKEDSGSIGAAEKWHKCRTMFQSKRRFNFIIFSFFWMKFSGTYCWNSPDQSWIIFLSLTCSLLIWLHDIPQLTRRPASALPICGINRHFPFHNFTRVLDAPYVSRQVAAQFSAKYNKVYNSETEATNKGIW